MTPNHSRFGFKTTEDYYRLPTGLSLDLFESYLHGLWDAVDGAGTRLVRNRAEKWSERTVECMRSRRTSDLHVLLLLRTMAGRALYPSSSSPHLSIAQVRHVRWC